MFKEKKIIHNAVTCGMGACFNYAVIATVNMGIQEMQQKKKKTTTKTLPTRFNTKNQVLHVYK